MLLNEPRFEIPRGHPIHGVFRRLTERGLGVAGCGDRELVQYLSEMLVRFVHVDSLYRIRDERGVPLDYVSDMMREAERMDPTKRREAYRHSGDFALFVLGFYPERLGSRRRAVTPEDYVDMGRRSYAQAAAVEGREPPGAVLRRLSAEFENCAVGLHLVRDYTHDPFYQYMLRQYGLS